MKSILDILINLCDEHHYETEGVIRYCDESDNEFYASYDINDGEPIVKIETNDFNVSEDTIEKYIYDKCIEAYNISIDERAFEHYVRNLRY